VREFASFVGITRRALSINYFSPLVCEMFASSSGSGGAISASLEVEQTNRLAGPANLSVDIVGGQVTLFWTPQPYAEAYVVYLSSVSAEGPFIFATANLLETSFILNLTPGTYWAKVTLIESDFGESFPSPIVEFTVT